MKDYVELANRTEAPITPELLARMASQARCLHAVMGLTTEVGELADAYKRHVFYGAHVDPVNVVEEVGDICWYLAILMDELGFDFDTAMEKNIAKLQKRYPGKFTERDAVTRNLEGERKVLE